MKPKLLWTMMALPTALFPTPLRLSPTTKSGALRAPRELSKDVQCCGCATEVLMSAG